MHRTVFRLFATGGALFAAGIACAQPALQNLDALERRLVIALGADVGAPGGPTMPLDRRLKLAACPGEVAIDPPALGAATLRCAAIGWRIRVPLVRDASAAAAVAVPPAVARAAYVAPVRAQPVVRRGDPVELRAGQGSFTVSSQVIAEQDGAPGDRIRVRGDARSAPVMVEVVDSGIVRLPGFKGF